MQSGLSPSIHPISLSFRSINTFFVYRLPLHTVVALVLLTKSIKMSRQEIQALLLNQKHEIISSLKEYFEETEPEQEPRVWLKSSEVCEQLSCSPSTICRMRNEGLLPYSLIQGTYYHKQVDVDQMMENGRVS